MNLRHQLGLGLVVLALGSLSRAVHAADVGAGYTNAFIAQPAAADWSCVSIEGSTGDVTTIAGMDALVQGVAPAGINQQVAEDPTDPPAVRGTATWCSSGAYLQTRPTGCRATLLMCTLVNGTGTNVAGARIRYDHAKVAPAAEEVEGFRLYYRLATASSWSPILELSSTPAGRVTGEANVNWPAGGTLYLLWADDNGSPVDTANQIDNFSAESIPVVPLVITHQPQSQSNLVGRPSAFSVGVSGAPVSYQWRKNGTNIAGATGASYSIANSTPTHSGDYTVVVTNTLSVVTSDVARLVVVPDTFGPRAMSAVVSLIGSTNQISVTFNEKLASATVNLGVATTNHFVVEVLGTTNRLTVNVFYNSGIATNAESYAIVRVGGPHWNISGTNTYVLTINRVKDSYGNVIAPDTRLPVLMPRIVNVPGLIVPDAEMHFHAAATFDPTVYSQPWHMADFVPGYWWGQARGPFCGGVVFNPGCLGAFQFEMGYQPEPYLFRASFVWPQDLGSSATLNLGMAYDDGMVAFLNGVEILRFNVPTGAVSAATRSISEVAMPACYVANIPVTQLQSGTNWLAVALVQSSIIGVNGGDAAFGVQLNATETTYPARPLPAEPPPALFPTALDTNRIRLSWAGSGYALEFTTNLPAGPFGPWLEVTNMSNPFTNALSGAQRFFRLHKPAP